MPQLRSLQDKYPRQMVILGVDTGERADTPQAQAALGTAAARRFQLNYPVLLNGDPVLWPKVEARVAQFQAPGEDREGTGGPRKAVQILHELTFPMPPGPHEWIVGRDVVIRFKRPEAIPADLVALSVDGKQIAAFGP